LRLYKLKPRFPILRSYVFSSYRYSSVGELSELLVMLGHADDAAALQKAVAAAMASHAAAAGEAKGCMAALDAADAAEAGLALFTLFCSQNTFIDSQHGPCNQSDIRE
jgi:hypothetical protein